MSASIDSGTQTLTYATARGRWVIAATVLGSGMAMLDGTVVGLALPAIGRDFHTGLTMMQWIVNAYMLALSGLLLLGGALGDRFGRRRMFVAGTIGFAGASLLCGAAWSPVILVVARGLQGVAGALLTPGSLAILQASFTRQDRSRAIGAWTGLGGIAAAIGPFVGGALIGVASWRFVFFINVPIAVAVVLISARFVPESRDPARHGRLDVAGAALAALGLAGVTYGLMEGPQHGWTIVTIVSLAAGATALVTFVVVEARVRDPLMPLAMFRSMQFSATNGVTFVVYGAMGGAMFLLPVVLQKVARYTALQAGVALLPLTVVMLLLSSRSGALAAKIGPRLQVSVGPLVIAAGLALFVRIDASGSYATQVLPAVLVFGLGLAITVAPLTATVLAAAPPDHVGIASAVNNDVARAAALIAVAILPPLARLDASSIDHPTALADGFHRAALLAAAACTAGGLISLLALRKPTPS